MRFPVRRAITIIVGTAIALTLVIIVLTSRVSELIELLSKPSGKP